MKLHLPVPQKLFDTIRAKTKKNDAENIQKPIFTIFAGVNGVGKTSLYEILKVNTSLGERVNIDEIVLTLGSWRDTLVQVKATREALTRINHFIDEKISFHLETTLPGSTITRSIKRAKAAGFQIRLYFVGVDSCDIAIGRVHQRVEKGGHGIDDNVVRKRYENLPERLCEVLPLCDAAIFYDNTTRFRQIGIMRGENIIDLDPDLPEWFYTMVKIPQNEPIARLAKKSDLPKIMPIFEEARASMARLGIDQWQDGYPFREDIENDIANHESYVLCINRVIVASFAVLLHEDATYRNIVEGEWLTGNTTNYAAVHRVAVSGSGRRRGLATALLSYAYDLAMENRLDALRIDTHEGNLPMRRTLEKNGFIHCGTIFLENGDTRVAYEKIVARE